MRLPALYTTIALETKNHPKFKFVWITDGQGWGYDRYILKGDLRRFGESLHIMDLDEGVIAFEK
jgi:hypothetical protein